MFLRQAFKKLIKKKSLLLVGIIIIITFVISGITRAEEDDNKPKPIMENGEIVFEVKSTAGSTNIRYRTIGFTISLSLQTKTVTAKGLIGPDAPPTPNKQLIFDKKIEKERDENYVITEFRISKEKVKAAVLEIAGLDLDKISKITYVYLHGIFQTYQIKDNGTEEIRRTGITTWKDIVNAESWKDPTVFERYFNIAVEFKPGLQENNLHFVVNGKNVETKELEKLYIGEPLKWKEKVTPTYVYKNETYKLVGYYAKSAATNKEVDRKMVGGNITANDIINGSVKVEYGGMDIYMLYEKKDVKVTIHAADIDTDKIIKENLYIGSVEPGKQFERAIDKTIKAGNVTYYKTKHFYYYVKDSPSTKIVTKTENDDDPIKFKAFSKIDSNDEIIVIAYYKKISPGTIPVTVNAVNKDTKTIITTLTNSTVQSGETYKYTVNETLTYSGKTYNFTGEWKWQYKKKTPSAPIVSNSGRGVNISFKVPSADEIDGEITVNVYYKLGDACTGDIDLRVTAVTKTGAFIEEVSKETVTIGQSINKPIQTQIIAGKITYRYIDKWDYTYITSAGDITKTGSGSTASFKVPSDTMLGTVITLRLYYDSTQSVEVPDPLPPIVLPVDSPSPYAVIDGDRYGSQYFISKEGISTTESQHVYVKTKDYLLGYRLVNKTGKIAMVVPVTMTYTLKYCTPTPEEFGGPKEVIDIVTDTQYISVERAYSYWEIESLEYYIPSSANVYNYSLPNEWVSLSANSAYLNVPSLSTRHSSNIYDHIILPRQVTEGIHLTYEAPIISEDDYRPEVDFIDLTSYAWEMTDELQVKNDYLMFDGTVVMSEATAEKIAPVPNAGVMVQSNNLTHDKVFFKEGLIIDALKKNGIYTSNGNVTYQKHPMSVNTSVSSKSFNMSVNNVIIHTPVICDPIIHADNDKWVQLIEPDADVFHIVLDPDTSLNDFMVRISNKLPHSDRLGYYERDFSKSFIDPENVSYIAKKDGKLRNEMKLPFDVFMDVNNDNKPENDEFIKAGTWIILDRETHRFYVPMWVQEGVYTAEFRTVAVNGEDKLSNTETTRNSNINNYIATATRTFQVSGRIYGLTLYDISDEGRWKDVFRVKDTMKIKLFEGAPDGTKRTGYHDDYAYYYTVGTKNQYGLETGRYSKYTLPLINGSHPKYNNIGTLKTGYAFRFMLDTTGEMYGSGCRIRIVPTFYHVDKNGKNRQLVDIYYDEEINGRQHYLVKIGESIDLVNVKQGQVGNPYSRIPEEELKHTALVSGTTYSKLKNQYGIMYTYSDIRISSQFRTFTGLSYAKHISGLPSYSKVKELTGETELSLSKYMQRWYGTYKLPTNIHVVPAGYDVYGYLRKHGIDYSEDFWLKDGYIIVNFNIETIDKNGKRHLSYINGSNYLNRGHCSMWVTEGATVQKKDNKGITFDFKAGDVVVYYVNRKYKEDFIGILY